MLDSPFDYVYLTGLVAGSVVRALYTLRSRQRGTGQYDTPLDSLLVFITSLGMIVVPLIYVLAGWPDFADYSLPLWASIVLGVTGAIIFVAAIWLLWRSHVDLGSGWSPRLVTREEQTLVTKGVYRRIRHPMYAAHWLWAIAQALLLQNWIAGLAMLVTMLPLYLVRAPREEKMMIERFGNEYRAYMSRTGRILPRVRQ